MKFPFRVCFGQVVDLHVNALQPWRPVVELYWISLPRKEIVTKHQWIWVRVQHQRSDHGIPLLFLLSKNKSCKSWQFFQILFFQGCFFWWPLKKCSWWPSTRDLRLGHCLNYPKYHLNFSEFTSSRWWFQIFLDFLPLFGEDFQFDEHIFQMGWFNHQPVMSSALQTFASMGHPRFRRLCL